ncbi:hypothetical protein [Celeribacter persicus]|uniref:Uncharacterized protein n=1 Tax=Celeribacter persicus TaxID=1651082 RepID=A0A2T5HUN3_9RHOB|nr:hypothetical protein [Celeribacter persicus]PTQ75292.1 hypothetical protein C8N42_102212 [Celeribacter persicus]
MTSYHIALLALASVGTAACVLTRQGRGRIEPLLGLAAMTFAMSGSLPLIWLGMVLLVGLTAHSFVAATSALESFHMLSHLSMTLVIGALFLLNGAGVCGDTALPLLSPQGITPAPLSLWAVTFVYLTLLTLAIYALLALFLTVSAFHMRQRHILAEVAPMCLATVGMAVGFS